ncbi:hypothetical protein glysoja_030335 [Glycine soja]|uniref:GIL1/IRKI C-terminal domain-containing protein n=1 Tax=Glycine soja TaxID=3848 RepID=A0A0B2PFG6_GLYSO|nr:hypothetical protein glysoja_030335 [Glycine soja]
MRNSWVTAKGYYTKNVLFCLHTTQLAAFPYLITCSHYKQLLTQSQSAPLFPFHPYIVTTTLIAEHNHPHSNNCHRQPQHAATLLRQQELKKEVKVKDLEVKNLREKLDSAVALTTNGSAEKKPGRSLSKRKLGIQAMAAVPTPELFEATMMQVRESSKSFTSLLLSLMHNAHWDITAAVRSIEAATASTDKFHNTSSTTSIVSAYHAKYALESYISRKIFQGFDHETFYMDGSLSSLLNPDQFRRDCFTQYRDMKSMDPTELLGILPTCHFGKFCSKKYLAIVHPKMEESLFGNLEQHSHVQAGNHPRSEFYNEFLGVAKTVWLLHLLAFSLNPAPSQFEASRGAEFHPQYMDSVVKFSGGRVPAGQVVGFPVSPGFKLGNGSVIKARVYLIART